MRERRFDKQLRFVFTVLSGLVLLVGITSIGINRHLIKSYDGVLAEMIAVIQRAERVGGDANVARSLAGELVRAREAEAIKLIRGKLIDQIAAMETGIQDLRRFLDDPRDAPAEVDAARIIIDAMATAAENAGRLGVAVQEQKQAIDLAAGRLAAMIAAQTDLARLRITADVWDMYSATPGGDVRPALDRLADRDFFAFERIGELAAASAQITGLFQRVADSRNAEALPGLRAAIDEDLRLARSRTAFLPSRAAGREIERDLSIFAAALEDRGLIGLQADALETSGQLLDLSERLDADLDALTTEALAGRDAARAEMRRRVSQAGQRAAVLSLSLALAIVAGLGIGGWVWLYARRRIVARLGLVSERIVAVARGDIGQRLPISGHDEIGRLEKAVNVLRRRTEEAARLRDSLEAAVRDRTADVVSEMNLANAARADAEKASRDKMHFLARMSHEIRTPLNGVIGMLHLLETEDTDPASRQRLHTALRSAEDLRMLTDDILTFASGEDGQRNEPRAAFDPGRLAEHLGEHLRALAAEKGLAVAVTIPPDLPPALVGEGLRIRQIVGNLISNAVKYTRQGEVRLDVTHRAQADASRHEIAFSVTDTGPGMTAQEALHAFDVYGRTDAARRGGVQGIGLGLAIARQLTDEMGGTLHVSSEPGRGSRFTLRLQLPLASPLDLPTAEAEPQPLALRQHVLVVDDHAVNRLVARGYLERMGCSVAEAETGAEALALAAAARFDAMLVDLDLPDMNGAEVCARIERKQARLVVVTADLVDDDPQTRQRFGVDHVLSKPVSSRLLAEVLARDKPPGAEGLAAAAPLGETEAVLRQDLAEMGRELTTEILESYLEDLATALPRLLGTTDAEERRRVAHRLKGASANFALHELCDLLRHLQNGEIAALGALAATAGQAEALIRDAASRAGIQLSAGSAKT